MNAPLTSLILVGAMALASAASAQEAAGASWRAYTPQGKSTEISVGYGALPAMRWMGSYDGHWNHINPWGSVSLSLDHRFTNRLWMGVSYSISSASTSDTGNKMGGSVVWHSLLVHARYYYAQRQRWSMYATVGAGVIISYMQPEWEPTYNRTRMGFEVVPLGAQFRVLHNFDIFAEAGFGVQGLVRAGVRVDL